MILINATIKYKGYDPRDLLPQSNKRICVACDECGKVRYVRKCSYHSLCNSCKQTGKNNHQWKGGLIEIICKQCGIIKKISQSEIKNSRYYFCSSECWSKFQIGKTNSFYGKHHSDESKEKMKDSSQHLSGKDHPNWQGGIAGIRNYVLPKSQCVNLNSYFKGSNFHHIMSGVGIYIPKDMHRSIYHSLKSGQNMLEINKLALDYLVGDL